MSYNSICECFSKNKSVTNNCNLQRYLCIIGEENLFAEIERWRESESVIAGDPLRKRDTRTEYRLQATQMKEKRRRLSTELDLQSGIVVERAREYFSFSIGVCEKKTVLKYWNCNKRIRILK